jgi:maltose operon protein
VAQHAATGVFKMSVGDLETSVASTTQYVAQQQGASRYVAPTSGATSAPRPVVAPPAPKPVPRADNPAASQPMLGDTQAIYDRMIQDSVAKGDMDRAWRLVQEAERAGSTTARQTFLNAVSKK